MRWMVAPRLNDRGAKAAVSMVFVLASAVASTGLPVDVAPVHAAPPIFVEYLKPTPGPRGAVTILGDSVMLGSAYETDGYGPSLAQMLVERGWGPILTKAGVGFQAGANVGTNPGANMSRYVLTQRAAGWDSPVYAIDIGHNDILGCSGSQSCAETNILGLVDTIGPGHEVWFAEITMTRQSDANAWNNALLTVAAQRPFVRLWDWPAVRAATGIAIATDNIHLPTGAAYRQRSELIADDITERFGVSQPVGQAEQTPTAVGGLSEYLPLPLVRAYDSRTIGKPVESGAVVEIDLSASVPPASTAVSVNVTAVVPSAAGFLTAYPCGGAPPPTSSVNFLAGEIRPNHVVVGLGPGARLCVLSSAQTDVIVDLQGAFVAEDGLRLTPLTPVRLADTRVTGRTDPLVVTAPAGAAGVVLNLTAVGAAIPGFVVAYPCGSRVPRTSNLNFVTDAAAAGSAYVPAGTSGTVCIHASVPADLVVDLLGSFSEDGDLRFQAAAPQRMLDTRTGVGGWRGQVGVGQQIAVGVAPSDARAVTGNITMIEPGVAGFQTVSRCDGSPPVTSSVNADRGLIAANSLTSPLSASLCIRSSAAAHLVFDTTGWWI